MWVTKISFGSGAEERMIERQSLLLSDKRIGSSYWPVFQVLIR
jgi:hypothetical protein